MANTIIILTSLSTAVLILGILFEGRLKKSKKNETSITSLKSEWKKLSGWGVTLILLITIINSGNCYLAVKNANDSEKQHSTDTTRISSLINSAKDAKIQFQMKRVLDSTQILNLEKLTLNNGLKSDSIKSAVVNNAIKAFKEQQAIIEREKENIFVHLRNEVKYNLQNMLIHFRRAIVVAVEDSNNCMFTRLDNTYITKYGSISGNKVLINNLMETSDNIDNVNHLADLLCIPTAKGGRKTNIDSFIRNVEFTQDYLYPLYNRMKNLESYKEFEAINFSMNIPIDTAVLNRHLIDDFEERPPIKKRIEKLPNGGIRLIK